VPSQLSIYLRNHEAAARGGHDLLRRAASSQRRRPYGDELHALVLQDREDLDALRQLMARLDVPPDRLLGAAARLGERAGRLKPNGRLVRRAPLSDLVEIEGVLLALQLKAAGWRALEAVGVSADDPGADLGRLVQRAEAQLARVTSLHAEVATTSLRTD